MGIEASIRLTVEIECYKTRKAEWLQCHLDQFVVIKGKDLVGFFSTFHDAYCAGSGKVWHHRFSR